MAAKKQDSPSKPHSPRIANKKARHDYHIEEVVECGLALVGTEVKSFRMGNARIDDAFARIRDGEVFLVGMNIAQYSHATAAMQHEPMRDRKLLLHRRQVRLLEAHIRQKGKTVIPLAIYFKGGWAKCELGVAVGKRSFDKRESIKKRDQQREIAREMTRRRR